MADAPSILLIVVYFGKFPSYVDFFLRSCAENPTVNWLIVTDQSVEGRTLPPNVAIKRTTFAALQDLIEQRMGFRTALAQPYKLCDFRPAYGVIFSEEISEYAFWGHCDLDVIFGNLRNFLTAEILRQFDKVLLHGHLSLYRNCDAANHYFELAAPGVSFRDVFTSPKSRAFDEFGGVRILLNHHGIPVFRADDYFADIDPNVYRLEALWSVNYPHQCFFWERGQLFKAFWNGEVTAKRDYMYIHLQKRTMTEVANEIATAPAWYVTPRGFAIKGADPSTPDQIDAVNPTNMLFDSTRAVLSSFSRVHYKLSRKVDPWPRRA